MHRIENIHDEFETNQSWSNVIQFSTTIYHTFASMKNVGNYSSRTEIIEKEKSKKYAQKELFIINKDSVIYVHFLTVFSKYWTDNNRLNLHDISSYVF